MWNEIVPADREHLLQLRGLPVCIFMKDGARHYGVLTGCSQSKVVLNGTPDDTVGQRTGVAGKGIRKRSAARGKNRRPRRAAAESSSSGKPVAAVVSSTDGWGTLELEGPPPVAGRTVLPLGPIEAVLLL
jgi:hypothetical protein